MPQTLRQLAMAGVVLTFAVSLATAQTTPTPRPQTPGSPSGSGGTPAMSERAKDKHVDGPVKGVDPISQTVRVGWFLGLFSTTLNVTPETRIAVDGAAGSLQDLREGDVVKAAYAEQNGQNIAKSIEVTHAESPRKATAPARSPGSVESTGPAPSGTKAP